ncbi:type II secretion system protein M [Bradyrhizobium sp. KB893862 SZCCT0404]|uniref:type II secretion system protein GspM n=1 Tax=Bradyrhizobium sp. KB893862 SZCCT0404 TaxID=2807672 RepID=UPI001BAAFC37|nr:type II secretion system protein GspM [Bradyrhizobium sp. KB893862 SZCCT0404]MBR1175256.1 type II secretion system protein M [Bradyrhizobium sp. KB893862 SZCCT0404]
MNKTAAIRKFLGGPLAAAASFIAVTALLLLTIISSLSEVLSQRAEIAAATAMLDQLEGRRPAVARRGTAGVGEPSGSRFLEGATVTVAAATLLQRVTAAVVKQGGNVLSSQVDLQGTGAKAGFLSVMASCEIDQPGLQQLLYDVEAGMPFLFIDQLVVQAPLSFGASTESKLRVLLTVSGQWKGS